MSVHAKTGKIPLPVSSSEAGLGDCDSRLCRAVKRRGASISTRTTTTASSRSGTKSEHGTPVAGKGRRTQSQARGAAECRRASQIFGCVSRQALSTKGGGTASGPASGAVRREQSERMLTHSKRRLQVNRSSRQDTSVKQATQASAEKSGQVEACGTKIRTKSAVPCAISTKTVLRSRTSAIQPRETGRTTQYTRERGDANAASQSRWNRDVSAKPGQREPCGTGARTRSVVSCTNSSKPRLGSGTSVMPPRSGARTTNQARGREVPAAGALPGTQYEVRHRQMALGRKDHSSPSTAGHAIKRMPSAAPAGCGRATANPPTGSSSAQKPSCATSVSVGARAKQGEKPATTTPTRQAQVVRAAKGKPVAQEAEVRLAGVRGLSGNAMQELPCAPAQAGPTHGARVHDAVITTLRKRDSLPVQPSHAQSGRLRTSSALSQKLKAFQGPQVPRLDLRKCIQFRDLL